MKKLRLLLLVPLIILSGCTDGNYSGSGSGTYKHIHIQLNDKIVHSDIISYKFQYKGTTVEVNTKDYGWISMNNGFMLYNSDKCPLCGIVKY